MFILQNIAVCIWLTSYDSWVCYLWTRRVLYIQDCVMGT